MSVRAVWAVAAVMVGGAVIAAAWPRTAGTPAAIAAGSSAAPMPAPTVPAMPAAPAPAASVLEDYLGGSLAAPTTSAPTLSVGTAARIERLDDRTVRVDDRFTIRGSGTERDPYLVTWELLSSAMETVDAPAGKFVIPGRIADLRGAWVRISGYWAPPVQAFEARELMVMLNKWDGCCIGLPPTPFDSIEATLSAPMPVKGEHLFRFGTITGRLEVEPFVAGSFLLGLYRLQDAVMESSS
jgi:hypothetical protein